MALIETGFLPDPHTWHLWNDTLALLDLAAKRGGIEPWADGDLLWIAIEDGQVIGAVTSRLTVDGVAEVKNIAGVQIGKWLKQIDEQIEDWARCHACPLMVSRGRKGWIPIVRKWGWQKVGEENSLTLFEKVL